MNYNNEFQEIDTKEKAYFLGLMYADGYISNTNYSFGVVLQNKDNELILKLQHLYPFLRIKNEYNCIRLLRSNKLAWSHLKSNGIFPRKSYENKENLQFPYFLHKELYSHFVRGFFDGDGSVFKQKIGNIKIELGGVGYTFIIQLLKYLFDNKVKLNITISYSGEGNRKQDYYKIYTSSAIESLKFRDLIYKDDCISMNRKKEFFYAIPEYKNLEDYQKRILDKPRINCINCQSSNTMYNGIRQMKNSLKYRLYCNDCKRGYSVTAPISSNTNSGEDELLES